MVDATDFRGPVFLKPTVLKPAVLGPEYNDFLFASIGADATGTYLTVVSALARLDLDPWAEAAKFSRMPKTLANQKLIELISNFSEIPTVSVDSVEIAVRLTALLPATVRSKIPVTGLSVQALHPAARTLMAPRFIFFLMSLTLGVMLVTQLIVAQIHPADQRSTATQTVTRVDSSMKSFPGTSDAHETEN
jgi:hypothetical protein